MNTDDLEEMAGLIHFRAGAWQDFGYEKPPAPECATIPPLGQRSASAIKAGHDAIAEIDQLTARLHQVRAQLVSELRQDSDIRAARVDAMLAERLGERTPLTSPSTAATTWTPDTLATPKAMRPLMPEVSLEQPEIGLIMKGIAMLYEHGMTDDERDTACVLAFKMGMAAHDVLRENDGCPPASIVRLARTDER